MAFKKYRRRPLEIEAVQWVVGETPSESAQPIVELVNSLGGSSTFIYDYDGNIVYHPRIVIQTLEGKMYASPGDYICRGIKGEFYPVKPDIFERINEPAVEPTTGTELVTLQEHD